MKLSSLFAPSTRRRTFAVLTVVMLVLALAINIGLPYLVRYSQLYLDTTPEGLYTLTDRMVEECDKLFSQHSLDDGEIKIVFCADSDQLISSAPARAVYFMALQMQRKFDCFSVETVNLTYEPSAVAAYKTTSLSTISETDVILVHGDTYRITNIDSFWTTAGDAYWSYNGEYKLASMLLSLLGTQRVAYFVTGHQETVYDVEDPTSEQSLSCATLYDLLVERGLRVDTLDLKDLAEKKGEIPEDCALLIINNPREDFSSDAALDSYYDRSECEIIDRYLVGRQGALMVAKDYRITLKNLENYLFEWGYSFGDTLVKDEKESLADPDNTDTVLVGQYNTDEGSYGYAIYGDFAALASSPSAIVSDSGYIRCSFDEAQQVREDGDFYTYRTYAPFLTTSDAAKTYAYDSVAGDYVALDNKSGILDLCAASVRQTTDSQSSESKYSYVFAAASASFFSEELLSNTSYANYDVVSSLVHNIARVDEHASMDLGGTSLNSSSFGGKQLLDTSIATKKTDVYNAALEVVETNYALKSGMKVFIIVVTLLPAAAALTVGIAVAIRRRYL